MPTPFDKVCRSVENVSLAEKTSMGVGGCAKFGVFPETSGELKKAVSTARENNLPFVILGGGTNVIASNKGFSGAVIFTTEINQVSVNRDLIKVGAGWTLSRFISTASAAGFAGFEKLSGIPGTIGGAVAMNAGAMDASISDNVYMIEAVTPEGEEIEYSRPELEFSYRSSPFLKSGEIIVTAVFKPQKDDVAQIRARSEAALATRRDRQPLGRSAGCIFKNPPDAPAGRIIDQAGLKGARIGGAVVSNTHANWIIAEQDATANDVLELVKTVKDTVQDKMGIRLELEVRILQWNGLTDSTD